MPMAVLMATACGGKRPAIDCARYRPHVKRSSRRRRLRRERLHGERAGEPPDPPW
jgi:hypothetical protein